MEHIGTLDYNHLDAFIALPATRDFRDYFAGDLRRAGDLCSLDCALRSRRHPSACPTAVALCRHWFGTDELGRDILSRVIFGTRISLFVSTSVVGIALFFGLIFGSIAGFYGGWLDAFLNVLVMNTFMALPGILIAIALVAFLGPGMTNLILALSITGWVGYARLVRAQVLAVREREFVEAARAMGATNLRIVTRHILPNIIQPVMVQAAMGMAGTILAEATLSFLGLGVPPPMPSWGVMLNDARAHLFDAPHMVIFPAIAIMLAVLSFNFIGDSLRDQLDPRTRVAVGVDANYYRCGLASFPIPTDCCVRKRYRHSPDAPIFCTLAISATTQFSTPCKRLRRSLQFEAMSTTTASAAHYR